MMTFLIAMISLAVVLCSFAPLDDSEEVFGLLVWSGGTILLLSAFLSLVSCMIGVGEANGWNAFITRNYWSIQILKWLAAVLLYLFNITPDSRDILIYQLKKNAGWWIGNLSLLGSVVLFESHPFFELIKPSFAISDSWYSPWFGAAALFRVGIYWLPSTMGIDKRMIMGLFWTICISSILLFIVFHIIFLGLWCIGHVFYAAGKRPNIISGILHKCAFVSTVCCLYYIRCGNYVTSGATFPIHMSEGLKDPVRSFERFLPVASASYYPHLSQWVIYGKLHCSGSSCPETSDKISPVYSLWAIIMCYYIASYVVRSQGWADTHPLPVRENKPNFKEMVPWYSGTSADLYKTAVDLLVSATIFIGRFDMRMMQAVKSKVHEERAPRDDFLFKHFSEVEDLWFDFMADTGDGGNSSYTVAHLLAQPKIRIEHTPLQRGKFLLIGGDLAYPNPSAFSYEKRLFRPFEFALQPPPFYKPMHITVNKVPCGGYEAAPQCFVIPGNHDWIDGLQTFTRYICHRSWLGGWWLPQKRSYFALKLPKGWWAFGLDQALHKDIDDYQFKFFADLIEDQENGVQETDSVIVMTHEPNWLLDWYSNYISGKNDVSGNDVEFDDDDESGKNHKSGLNVSHLIRRHLKGRCKLRIAGDLHHYMHHTSIPSDSGNSSGTPVYVQHLLVNGCGGAFLHPTHTFENFKNLYGTSYECKNSYPSFEDSRKTAWRNIINFRNRNREFDIVSGVIYFILTFSMFPQDQVCHIVVDDWFSGFGKSFFSTAWSAFVYMISHSYVSLAGTLLFLLVGICFVPTEVPLKRRIIIGTLHVSAHIFAAVSLMLLFNLGVEICIRYHLLDPSGYHTSYELYRLEENKHFPDPGDLRGWIERWTVGIYPKCIKYLMLVSNVPEVMAVTRANICEKGLESLSRLDVIIYYVSVFLCFWFFSTYMVSLVFGSYLCICVNFLNLHYDEAFSALRTENFKAFTRFHIKNDGDLEVFTLAVDKVPKDWKRDQGWSDEQQPMSHLRVHPSEWTAADDQPNPIATVRIVDHFEIERGYPPNRPNFEACNALRGR